MGSIASEKLFRPITRRMEKIPEDEFIVPDYDINDQTRNFKNVLPFGEGNEYEYEEKQGVPDYSLLEEDTPLEEEEDPDKALLPESDDEVFPDEKQRRHSAPTLSQPPAYSPPPSYRFQKRTLKALIYPRLKSS